MDNYLSDGEISNETEKDDKLEAISSEEDEYFKNLTTELEKRKIFLELENELYSFDDYAKENRSHNHRSSGRRRKPSVTKKTEIRHRSFRASSVFSNYSMPKRKRSSRTTSQKKSRNHSRHSNRNVEGRSSDEEEEGQKGGSSDDDDDECELISLRLNALKSKQEFKEPEVPEVPLVSEEELLRIDALKSALLKKKPHFREKKLKRKMENERPYSPTDNLDRMLDDDPMEIDNTPVNSPFNQDDVNQMDMEISNSSPEGQATPAEEVNGEKDLSDMEIASSPVERVNEQIENDAEAMEEEKALRSLLLSSITNRRRTEEKNAAKNLKLAVERLRQAQLPTIQAPKKSGTKTIKMILDEKKSKKIEKPPEFEEQIKTEQNLLLNKITIEQNEVIKKLPTPAIVTPPAETDALLSTISDTKNIPLRSRQVVGTKKSRLLTSLDQTKRIVEPLIITVNAESSDDESRKSSLGSDSSRMVKKTHRKIVRVGNSFPKNTNSPQIEVIEKQVESILRKIRLDSDKKASQIKPTNNQPEIPKLKTPIKLVPSAVNHLPKSSQIEYALLKEKMKKLEEEKASRQKEKQLKRQKSINTPDKVEVPPQPKPEEPKSKPAQKVEDTLSKIRMLDEAARERFTKNAENKYLAHSQSLKVQTEETIRLIDASSLEIKRRDRVDAKIAEIERQLAKFKTMKKVVEHRINTSIPQIVRSQNSLIRLRNHQHNFGSMCSKVGEIVRGPAYRLPEGITDEINSNMSSILEKSDQITNICKDHFAIKHLKTNSQKIQEFIDEAKEKEKIDETPLVPESTEKKRVLVVEASVGGNAAKMVKYESPLEFLKASTEDSDNNLNRVVCPFALEGSCTDANCKMLHL